MSSTYEFDENYQKEIYPFDKNYKREKVQYALNETYALDHNNKPYYPRNLSTGEIYVLCKNKSFVPFFIVDNEEKINFANIDFYTKIHDTSYYIVNYKKTVGDLYIKVMTNVNNLDFVYKPWVNAGLVAKPFRFKQSHRSYKFGKDYKIYERPTSRHEDVFIFHDGKEVNVRFDHWGRLQFFEIVPVTRIKRHFDFYHDKTRLYYKLRKGGHKIYYIGKNGLFSDDAIFKFSDRNKILPFEFGQDLDRERKIFSYAIDGDSWKFKFDYVNGEIKKFDFDYFWEYKIYYTETPDGKKIYDPSETVRFEPMDLDCDMGYLTDESGREVYPKFDGNEFCHLGKKYALDSEKRPYYPTHKTKKLMVLCNYRHEPNLIRHLDIVMDDSAIITFLEQSYILAVFRKDYKPPITAVSSEEEKEEDHPIMSSEEEEEEDVKPPDVTMSEEKKNIKPPVISEKKKDEVKPPVIPEKKQDKVKPPVISEKEEEVKPSVKKISEKDYDNAESSIVAMSDGMTISISNQLRILSSILFEKTVIISIIILVLVLVTISYNIFF